MRWTPEASNHSPLPINYNQLLHIVRVFHVSVCPRALTRAVILMLLALLVLQSPYGLVSAAW